MFNLRLSISSRGRSSFTRTTDPLPNKPRALLPINGESCETCTHPDVSGVLISFVSPPHRPETEMCFLSTNFCFSDSILSSVNSCRCCSWKKSAKKPNKTSNGGWLYKDKNAKVSRFEAHCAEHCGGW